MASKVFWKIRAKVEDVGDESCKFRIDGDPSVHDLKMWLRPDSDYVVLVIDGKKHVLPREVMRIIQRVKF